jgi:Nif-specific regulatory protein
VIEIDVPPLRQRLEDVPLLAEHFLETFRQHADRRLDGFAPQTLELLSRYSWPGNVRELRNVIERAVVLGAGTTILPEDVSLAPLGAAILAAPESSAAAGGAASADGQHGGAAASYRPISLDQLEREHIEATLSAMQGNKSRAAAILGVERSTLDRKLKRYELERGQV